MIAAIFHGFFASLVVSVALAMSATSRNSSGSAFWASLALVVLITATAMVQRYQEKKGSTVDLERYDGGADLLVHIHAPGLPDRPSRWMLRGLLSWVLSGMGFAFGPEGVASELSQSARMIARKPATKWSDLRRRTDAALVLAAGMSAGFGAPFAAVLLPAELSVGGHVLTSVLAAVSAYVGIQFFSDFFGQYGLSVLGVHGRLSHLWGFRFNDWNDWFSAIVVCLVCTFGAILTLGVVIQGRVLIDRWGKKKASFASLIAGVLLLSVLLLSPETMGSLPFFFERVIRNELPLSSLIALCLSLFLTLCAVYTGIGSMGVWWPSFLLGAAVSMISLRGLVSVGVIHSGAVPNALLLGAVAWTVAWFRTPITVAVLAYELSGRGSLLIPALMVGWLARLLSERLQSQGWFGSLLNVKGFPIRSGRASHVLSTITAGDAMVRDFQTVRATDSIDECRRLILQGRYPFVAVVDGAGAFLGLLSADQVERGFRSQKQLKDESGDSRLGELLEAKDLLYRAESAEPLRTALVSTSLSELDQVFNRQSCLPVLSERGHPMGLIFQSDVRHAYDRELARLSVILQARSS